MENVVILEWTFSPPDYFEEPIRVTRSNYLMTIGNGKVEARIDPATYDIDPSMRDVLQGDRQHLFRRRHLQIERDVQFRPQPFDVVIGDVAAVFAQMRGDAVGAGLRRQDRRAHRIGKRPAARLAHGGDMVDINAEAQLRHAIAPSMAAP